MFDIIFFTLSKYNDSWLEYTNTNNTLQLVVADDAKEARRRIC